MPQNLTRRTLLATSAKTIRITVPAAMIVASSLALGVASAQLPANIKRTDLMKEDLSVSGREVVQVRVDIPAGVTAPKHNHPGEELVYVIEGALEYRLRRQAAGDTQGRRSAVHPERNTTRGEERRQRQRGRACHVHRRKRQATRRVERMRGRSP